MTILKIVLVDTNTQLINAWKKQLKSISNNKLSFQVHVHDGKIDSIVNNDKQNLSAIVSPANSIGGMGGGFDNKLCELFSNENDQREEGQVKIENWIRKYLHHGYTPLGTAHVIEFNDMTNFEQSKAWILLNAVSIIIVPTMRVPKQIYPDDIDSNIKTVRFIFDCIWETLCALDRHNRVASNSKINTLIIPGLGTGFGKLPIDMVAKGMVGAINIWGMILEDSVDRGLLCLSFLNENYNTFHNPNIVQSKEKMFKTCETFDIVKNDVGDFLQTLK